MTDNTENQNTIEQPAIAEGSASQETARKRGKIKEVLQKNKGARIALALVALALVACIVLALLGIAPFGTLSGIREEWKTPSYLRDQTINILVCGIAFDSQGDEEHQDRLSDVIMVANFDREAGNVNILQIPRDTYVGDDLVRYGKINGLTNWGYLDGSMEAGVLPLIDTINEQFALPVDNYVLITMEGFRTAVDMLGGVEVTLPEAVDFGNGTVLEAGTHLLDGAMAEQFVRYRDVWTGDIYRINNQRYFMAALMNKLMELDTRTMVSLASAIFPYLETDFTVSEIISLASEARGMSTDNVRLLHVPGEGVSRYGQYGVDVFSVHKQALADMLNEYMRPYSDDVSETELNCIEIQNTTTDYDDEGTILGEIAS
ncbi:MAG: LCP family protein [Oscillospiraceae bacterium]|nr:LCP family protein [Oscillospiraceae bacterium]